MIIITAIWFISFAAFVYTFVQPRYTATITAVGKVSSVSRSTLKKYGNDTYNVVHFTARYTDRDGIEQTVPVEYSRPKDTVAVGREMTIIQGPGKWIVYPWTGLRLFSGSICFAIGVFGFFMWLDRRGASRE